MHNNDFHCYCQGNESCRDCYDPDDDAYAAGYAEGRHGVGPSTYDAQTPAWRQGYDNGVTARMEAEHDF